MPPLRRAPLATRVALVIGSIVVAASLAEAGLRAAHFEYHIYPTVQFGWPDPTALREVYRADTDLIWVTRDFDEKLVAARQTHPAIVFMGDSCTEFGSYPSKTLERLQRDLPAFDTGVKFGV